MKALLMDAWRHDNHICLWLKTPRDIRIKKKFSVSIYADVQARPFLDKHNITYYSAKKKTYMGSVDVLEIPISLSRYESFVRWLEHGTKHRIMLYNADIKPEDQFLYRHKLKPLKPVQLPGLIPMEDETLPLTTLYLDIMHDDSITGVIMGKELVKGYEKTILETFARRFAHKDPDVIVMPRAFYKLPILVDRLKRHGLECRFHRWDAVPIRYKGGKSFYSYGRALYRDFAIRLRGRFLLDAGSMEECDTEAIEELCRLSGVRFQHIGSRSFGSCFQGALVREMYRDYLIPFKQKPVDEPMPLDEYAKADSAGHRLDPRPGFHTDVAEIDFSSMFPWLIYNHNISAETMLGPGKKEKLPGIPLGVSLEKKGLVPRAIKPFLDRRMEYKKNPTRLNRKKAKGLKWVLVTSYGYLRFREFKLGVGSSHMAIGALGRETLIKAMHIAQDHGFEVIHGIVDSLYIKREGIQKTEVMDLCRDIELQTGIPVSFEGIFRWIVFLPSVNDDKRPLPSTYYGVFANGEIKARGIEIRQKSAPYIVKAFQQHALEKMAKLKSQEHIRELLPELKRLLRSYVRALPYLSAEELASRVRISKTHYKNDIPQKIIIEKLREQGEDRMAGQDIHYVFAKEGIELPRDYGGRPDTEKYKEKLARALFVLYQPFGITKEDLQDEKQTTLDAYSQAYIHPSQEKVQIQQRLV